MNKEELIEIKNTYDNAGYFMLYVDEVNFDQKLLNKFMRDGIYTVNDFEEKFIAENYPEINEIMTNVKTFLQSLIKDMSNGILSAESKNIDEILALDGIDEVKISKETYDGVEKELTDTELVEDVSVRLQGRIVYTTIVLKSDTGVETAKEIAGNTLDNYDEDELKYYDHSFFLKWKGEEGDTVITGNRHHDLDSITWVRS